MTRAHRRRVTALLVDAAVRDVEELAELGLPIWACRVRIRGAAKHAAGTIDEPVVVGGQAIATGDVMVLDADGVTVVAQARIDEVLEASLARAARADQARAATRRSAVLRSGRAPCAGRGEQ